MAKAPAKYSLNDEPWLVQETQALSRNEDQQFEKAPEPQKASAWPGGLGPKEM
jgi:hypothetical protein